MTRDASDILVFPRMLDASLRDEYIVNGYVYDLYDGDTVYYHASLGYYQWAGFQVGRLADINSPELRPLVTREAAERAKAALWAMIQSFALNRHLEIVPALGYKLKIRSRPAEIRHFDQEMVAERGKYGRWLVELIGADARGEPVSLNELMIREGYAEPYEV